jgi:hypothetical protein
MRQHIRWSTKFCIEVLSSSSQLNLLKHATRSNQHQNLVWPAFHRLLSYPRHFISPIKFHWRNSTTLFQPMSHVSSTKNQNNVFPTTAKQSVFVTLICPLSRCTEMPLLPPHQSNTPNHPRWWFWLLNQTHYIGCRICHPDQPIVKTSKLSNHVVP